MSTAKQEAPNTARTVDTADGAEGGDAAQKKRKKKVGPSLAGTFVVPYVDDQTLYKERIAMKDRERVWEHMLEHRVRRDVPKDFNAFIVFGDGDPDVLEMKNYPIMHVILFKIITNSVWDFLYLFLFLIWLLVLIRDYDPVLQSDDAARQKEVDNKAAQAIPLFFMSAVQVIPIVGTAYFTIFCNDLVRQWSKLSFPRWAFCAVLVAQCLEFFLFGGKNRKGMSIRMDPNRRFFGGDAKVVPGDIEEGKVNEHGFPDFMLDDYGNPIDGALDEWDGGSSLATGSLQEGSAEGFPFPEAQAGGQGDKAPPPPSRLPKAENEGGEDNALFLRLKEEKRQRDLAIKKAKLEEARLELRTVKEWVTWTCVVCKRKNRRPKYPKPVFDIGFGEKGEFFKRTFAIVRLDRKVARCTKCHTYLDYNPPVGSSHLFKHYKEQYRAFRGYPKQVRIQSNLQPTPNALIINEIKAFFFGRRNNLGSKLVYNDWRLKPWTAHEMPENPRPFKQPHELYERGEVVECMLQKAEISRARIMLAHSNHTYDIKYGSGEEIRFVEEKHVRLPAEKRAYAYVVEAGVVVFILVQPFVMFLTFALRGEYLLGFIYVSVGLVGLPYGFLGLFLLLLRVLTFAYNFYRQYSAGCCSLFQMNSFFMIPPLFMTIAGFSIVGKAEEDSWFTPACLFAFSLFLTVPHLYMQRATFGAMGALIFLQVSVAAVLLGWWADGEETELHDSLAIHMAPAITTVATLITYRALLPNIWDVHLKIRPLMNFDPLNDTLMGQLKQLYRVFFPKKKNEEDEESDDEDFHDPLAGLDFSDDDEEAQMVGEGAFQEDKEGDEEDNEGEADQDKGEGGEKGQSDDGDDSRGNVNENSDEDSDKDTDEDSD